jgi:outer membrane protein assembly factor BamB
VADGKVYVGDEDGDFVVLAAKGGAKAQVLSETNLGAPVYSTPIVANGTMYVGQPDPSLRHRRRRRQGHRDGRPQGHPAEELRA